MAEDETLLGDASELRLRAEEMARAAAALWPENINQLSPEEAQRTLHELRVHQIELEMQNEELRRAQAALDTERERYFELYDLAPVGYITLSIKGLVLQSNRRATEVLGVAHGVLERKRFSQFILEQDQDTYYRLYQLLLKSGAPQSCELRLVQGSETPISMHLDATLAHDDEGHKILLITLNDLTERKHRNFSMTLRHLDALI